MIDDQQISEAVKRIALTADGKLLHLRLQRDLMSTCSNPSEPGALPIFEGGRRYAQRLKDLMDTSIAETTSGERAADSAERPIVLAARSGVDIRSQHRGVGRRVPVNEG